MDSRQKERQHHFQEILSAHRGRRKPLVPTHLLSEVERIGTLEWMKLHHPFGSWSEFISALKESQAQDRENRKARRKRIRQNSRQRKNKVQRQDARNRARVAERKRNLCSHGQFIEACQACASQWKRLKIHSTKKVQPTVVGPEMVRDSLLDYCSHGQLLRTCKACLEAGFYRDQEKTKKTREVAIRPGPVLETSAKCIHGLLERNCAVCAKRPGPISGPGPGASNRPEVALARLREGFSSAGFTRVLRQFDAKRQTVENFLNEKWAVIDSGQRDFGLAENRTYPIAVEVPLLATAGLTQIEFIPGHLDPPSIRVKLWFGEEASFEFDMPGAMKIISSPPIQRVIGARGERFLLVVAVMYYLDIVISDTRNEHSPESRFAREPGEGSAPSPGARKGRRSLPRRKSGSWRARGKKARRGTAHSGSFVDAFRRRLPRGQHPSFEKILEADQYGIHLKGPGYPKVQYTWVRPHSRAGGLEPSGEYRYTNYRAIAVLETLIDSLASPTNRSTNPSISNSNS